MAFADIELITSISSKKPTLSITHGADESAVIHVKDVDDCPYDLTDYVVTDTTAGGPCSARQVPITNGVLLVIAAFQGQSDRLEKVCTVLGDPTEGNVQITVAPCELPCPGIYMAEVQMVSDAKVKHVYSFYIEATASLAWDYNNQPVTVPEIRLWARDNDPETNDLLDEVEYKDSEIVAAIRRTIDLWNSTPPLLANHTYTVFNFPPQLRSQWIDMTIGFLKEMAADWYLRNSLEYSAGGVSLQHRNKYQQYKEDALMRKKQFIDWMAQIKRQLNAAGAFGRVGYDVRLP